MCGRKGIYLKKAAVHVILFFVAAAEWETAERDEVVI